MACPSPTAGENDICVPMDAGCPAPVPAAVDETPAADHDHTQAALPGDGTAPFDGTAGPVTAAQEEQAAASADVPCNYDKAKEAGINPNDDCSGACTAWNNGGNTEEGHHEEAANMEFYAFCSNPSNICHITTRTEQDGWAYLPCSQASGAAVNQPATVATPGGR
jgi:hypothetical protein